MQKNSLDTAWTTRVRYSEGVCRMGSLIDKETVALQSIVSSLAPLAADEKLRVLAYVNLRYGKNGSSEQGDSAPQAQPDEARAIKASTDYADEAALFEKAKPRSCSE